LRSPAAAAFEQSECNATYATKFKSLFREVQHGLRGSESSGQRTASSREGRVELEEKTIFAQRSPKHVPATVNVEAIRDIRSFSAAGYE